MGSMLRFRKLCFLEPVKFSELSKKKTQIKLDDEKKSFDIPKIEKKDKGSSEEKKRKRRPNKEWRCIDSCCWAIGYICTIWWLLLFLFNCLPVNLPGLKVPEPPGTRLKREGLTALHPIVIVPGIVTGGLELWEGRLCSEGLFRRRLWGGSFTEIFRR